jgi:signal transduction histidine kinase
MNAHTLQVSGKVQREGGPDLNTEIEMFVPFDRARTLSLIAWAVVFLLGVFMARGYALLLRNAVTLSLKPLEGLNEAIRRLATSTVPVSIAPIGIIELDQIRRTVSKTQGDLIATRDRLVLARAKELATDRYKRLIHDLHTPVACMSSVIALARENPSDDVIQKDAQIRIPRLASQVLAQLSAASKNTEFEEPHFKKEDLRATILEAKEQIAFIAADSTRAVVEAHLPDTALFVCHDQILLTRAVSNLLKNAVEAGAHRVVVALEEGGSGEAVIRIEDDGPGLNESEVSLYLVGRGRSSKRDRFAIGLSTVNHIVRSHGGKIIYRRTDLGGACFELRIQDDPKLVLLDWQGVARNV